MKSLLEKGPPMQTLGGELEVFEEEAGDEDDESAGDDRRWGTSGAGPALVRMQADDHREAWADAGLAETIARVFDGALPDEILAAAREEALLFDDIGTAESYWCPVGACGASDEAVQGRSKKRKHEHAQPRFAIEAAVHALYAADFGCSHSTSIIGAEWWVQRRRVSDTIEMHYDKDESLIQRGTCRLPPVSTVTYLEGHGAPTLVLDQTLPQDCARNVNAARSEPVLPSSGFLSYPKTNRHLVFRGSLQHGVPAALTPPHDIRVHIDRLNNTGQALERITLLVNFWSFKPSEPFCKTMTSAKAIEAKVLDACGVPTCIDPRFLSLRSEHKVWGSDAAVFDLRVDKGVRVRDRHRLKLAGA